MFDNRKLQHHCEWQSLIEELNYVDVHTNKSKSASSPTHPTRLISPNISNFLKDSLFLHAEGCHFYVLSGKKKESDAHFLQNWPDAVENSSHTMRFIF